MFGFASDDEKHLAFHFHVILHAMNTGHAHRVSGGGSKGVVCEIPGHEYVGIYLEDEADSETEKITILGIALSEDSMSIPHWKDVAEDVDVFEGNTPRDLLEFLKVHTVDVDLSVAERMVIASEEEPVA